MPYNLIDLEQNFNAREVIPKGSATLLYGLGLNRTWVIYWVIITNIINIVAMKILSNLSIFHSTIKYV